MSMIDPHFISLCMMLWYSSLAALCQHCDVILFIMSSPIDCHILNVYMYRDLAKHGTPMCTPAIGLLLEPMRSYKPLRLVHKKQTLDRLRYKNSPFRELVPKTLYSYKHMYADLFRLLCQYILRCATVYYMCDVFMCVTYVSHVSMR